MPKSEHFRSIHFSKTDFNFLSNFPPKIKMSRACFLRYIDWFLRKKLLKIHFHNVQSDGKNPFVKERRCSKNRLKYTTNVDFFASEAFTMFFYEVVRSILRIRIFSQKKLFFQLFSNVWSKTNICTIFRINSLLFA